MIQNLHIVPSVLCIAVGTGLAHAAAVTIAVGDKGKGIVFISNSEGMTADAIGENVFTHLSAGDGMYLAGTVGDFDLDLVKAGGWVSYADSRY